MKTIAVVHQKGGVGKTTIAINIALYFARNGANVAMADADAQGSLTASADLLDGIRLVSLTDVLNQTVDADLVVIDTSPRNDITLNAILLAADLVLIPVKPGYLDVLALNDTRAIIQQLRSKVPRTAIVLNMVPPGKNAITRETIEMLQGFAMQVLNTRLHNRVAYGRSTLTNGVFGSDDKKAQTEIESLATELLELL